VPDFFSSTPVTGVGFPVTAGTAPTTYQFEPPRSGTARTEPPYKVFYDPTLSPSQLDVPVGPDGEEIAVAILIDRKAYAFTTESYNYPGWANPEWLLELKKTYRIVVRISGSSTQKERAFKLEYLTNDVSKFRLEEIDGITSGRIRRRFLHKAKQT
jgi:hypothetical protein